MSKPYVGQIVEYRYKPETSAPPVAAIVTQLHGEKDGVHWVAIHVFTETSRWVPHVEFGHHCKPAISQPSVTPAAGPSKSASGIAHYPLGIFP